MQEQRDIHVIWCYFTKEEELKKKLSGFPMSAIRALNP